MINNGHYMNQKTQRLSVIRKIIRSEFISSQEELIARLEEHGVKITQSTLSRDLKFMHVAKVPHKDKGYIYVLPNNTRNDHSISTNVSDNIIDIAFSGNMCVITTKPGYASAISVPIDSKGISEVLGTIAGDNTILMILREGFDMNSLMDQLYMLFPSIRNLYFVVIRGHLRPIPKVEHPRLYVKVLSSGARFCDKPNLTPSNKKLVR